VRNRGLVFALVFALGGIAVWTAAHFAGPSFIAYDPVRVLEGETNGVNVDGSAIGFVGSGQSGEAGEGYIVAGAEWWQDDGAWNNSVPTCLVPLSSGQRVTLGVMEAPPGIASGREIVVWLECHGAPAQRNG